LSNCQEFAALTAKILWQKALLPEVMLEKFLTQAGTQLLQSALA
jgi:tellurite resistance-related uncharacterized protein